jgi:flagellar biosynthesis protein FlhB
VTARTEQPTPKRLREARRRGEVAVSREVTGLGALAGGALAIAATGPASAARLAAHVRAGLGASLAGDALELPGLALARAAGLLATTLAPPLAGALAGALAAGLLQTRGLLAPSAVRLRGERLHPARNLARLASPTAIGGVLLSLAKATIALGVAAGALRTAATALAGLPRLDAPVLLAAAPRLLAPLVGRLVLLLTAFAAVDLLLVRTRHSRSLRMTKDEVRREHRQDEGDPLHRAERRRRHRALLEAAPVSRATCVVVNPTHLAIALRHDRASGEAPVVIAKGAGAEAARIRAEARRAAVPVVRDVALARALWRLADLGEEIPEELYEAAAAVLVHVHRLPAEVLP